MLFGAFTRFYRECENVVAILARTVTWRATRVTNRTSFVALPPPSRAEPTRLRRLLTVMGQKKRSLREPQDPEPLNP
jgi:hypothetical protein